MLNLDALRPVRYVVDEKGRKSAVQVDIDTWSVLLNYLEDLEDRAILKDQLSRLARGPEVSGAISWQEAKKEW